MCVLKEIPVITFSLWCITQYWPWFSSIMCVLKEIPVITFSLWCITQYGSTVDGPGFLALCVYLRKFQLYITFSLWCITQYGSTVYIGMALVF